MAYFPEVKKRVKCEGPRTKNSLAFRWYDADRKVGTKTMKGHLRFAVAYGHTMKGEPDLVSGRQEMIENIVNHYLYRKDIA